MGTGCACTHQISAHPRNVHTLVFAILPALIHIWEGIGNGTVKTPQRQGLFVLTSSTGWLPGLVKKIRQNKTCSASEWCYRRICLIHLPNPLYNFRPHLIEYFEIEHQGKIAMDRNYPSAHIKILGNCGHPLTAVTHPNKSGKWTPAGPCHPFPHYSPVNGHRPRQIELGK